MENEKRDAIRALLKRRREAHTLTPEMAKKWLVEEGLLDEKGELQPQFGGEGNAEPDD